MSPSLLSKRLAELEEAGVLTRKLASRKPSVYEYLLTDAGRDLHSVVEAVGIWGQKWVSTKSSLENLDPSLLMWDMRRNLTPAPLPDSGAVIQFLYSNLPKSKQSWWLIVEESGAVDLCWSDPGKQVDLLVETDLRTMTAIWMGFTTVKKELGNITFKGDKEIAAKMQKWLGLSPFAVWTSQGLLDTKKP